MSALQAMRLPGQGLSGKARAQDVTALIISSISSHRLPVRRRRTDILVKLSTANPRFTMRISTSILCALRGPL